MIPNSDHPNLAQFNVAIPQLVKEEIKKKAQQSNLNLSEFVQRVFESVCENSTVPDALPNSQVRRQPKEQALKTSLTSNPTPMNSQLNLDQMIQCLNERLNRLEGAYVALMTQIQELQSLRNFYPLLNQLLEQPFSVTPPSVQPPFQPAPTETQMPINEQITAPVASRTEQAPSKVPPMTPQVSSDSQKQAPKQAASPSLKSANWLTAREAYQVACQKGYQKKLQTFVDISKSSSASQQYVQWGLACDPTRKGKPGHPGKWFRCLIDSEQ